MAGSGTLAIEHALAARGIAPGLRRRFGFERWPTLAPEARADWERMRAEAEEAAIAAQRTPLPPIVCADIDAGRGRRGRAQNASAASVDDAHHVRARRRRVAGAALARRARWSPTRPTASG